MIDILQLWVQGLQEEQGNGNWNGCDKVIN